MAVRGEGKCPKRMRLGCERGAEVLGEGHACMRVVAVTVRGGMCGFTGGDEGVRLDGTTLARSLGESGRMAAGCSASEYG